MWKRNKALHAAPSTASQHQRWRRFEQLESRRLMAVTTSLVGGILTVTGDAANDDIAIVGTSNPGELTLTGRNGTLVNGVPDGSTTIPGVSSDLRINLGDGANVLAIDNAYINGAITITSGAAADLVTLGEFQPVSPRNNLTINTAGGDDIVRLGVTRYTVFLAGNATINVGEGNNQAALYGASSIRSTSITAGAGDDSIYVYGFNASDGGLSLLGDAGNNSLAVIASLGRFGIFMRGWEAPTAFTFRIRMQSPA